MDIIIALLALFNINQVKVISNKTFLENKLARVNLNPRQKSYAATAKFWGLIADGVNQVSTVTLYPNLDERVLVTIILPQNCTRIFEINDTKITKVTYDCPKQNIDESSNYTDWFAFHDPTIREIKMIAPPVKLNNPIYIRQQAFWIIQY